eukprot:scaffold42258_cov244-Amphora_coffeaeformis.AAC.2
MSSSTFATSYKPLLGEHHPARNIGDNLHDLLTMREKGEGRNEEMFASQSRGEGCEPTGVATTQSQCTSMRERVIPYI